MVDRLVGEDGLEGGDELAGRTTVFVSPSILRDACMLMLMGAARDGGYSEVVVIFNKLILI
jgi:hypothetical protein